MQAQKQGEPLALVIVGVTVPGGMGTGEAAAQLVEIDPNVADQGSEHPQLGRDSINQPLIVTAILTQRVGSR